MRERERRKTQKDSLTRLEGVTNVQHSPDHPATAAEEKRIDAGRGS